MRKVMGKTAPTLSLETIKEFLPGWHDEMMRTGSIGRPIEKVVFGKIFSRTAKAFCRSPQAQDFANFVLKPHFAATDTLVKLILLEDGLEAYAKKYKKFPSIEDENEIRELLGLSPTIGS